VSNLAMAAPRPSALRPLLALIFSAVHRVGLVWTTWENGPVEAAGNAPDPASGLRPAAPSAPHAQRPRLVIVDDDQGVREALRQMLLDEGLNVAGEAGDGTMAVRMAAYLIPDVILMDWRMPVLDGLEATRQIVALGLGIKVIICTAFDGPTFEDQAHAAGAFEVFAKGGHPRTLIDLVRRAWRERQRHGDAGCRRPVPRGPDRSRAAGLPRGGWDLSGS